MFCLKIGRTREFTFGQNDLFEFKLKKRERQREREREEAYLRIKMKDRPLEVSQ